MTLRLAPSPWRTDTFRRLNNRLENVVGAKTAKPFETLKIWTVGDLMRHLPRRYFSGTELSDLSTLSDGEEVTVLAEVVDAKVFYVQRPLGPEAPARGDHHRPPRLPHADLLRPVPADQLLAVGAAAGSAGDLRRQGARVQPQAPAGPPGLRHPGRPGPGRRRGPTQRRPRPGRGEPADRAVPVDRQAADLDRRGVRRAGAGHPDRPRGPAAGLAPGCRRRGRPGDRVPVRPPAAGLRAGRARSRAAALRRGLRAAADHGLPPRRRRLAPGRAAPAADRRAAGRVRRPAAVHPDRGPGGGQRADLRRAGPDLPDAAAAAGRGRLGQDPGRAAGHAGGGRRRRAGGAAGAHRGARRPALLDGDPAAGRPRARVAPSRRWRTRPGWCWSPAPSRPPSAGRRPSGRPRARPGS